MVNLSRYPLGTLVLPAVVAPAVVVLVLVQVQVQVAELVQTVASAAADYVALNARLSTGVFL
jgi:hypothetical protein